MENQLNKVAVIGLDLTAMDETIIGYVPLMLEALSLHRIIFVHVAKKLEWPDELRKAHPALIAPLDESIAEDIDNKVRELFEGTEAVFDIIVQEGPALETFLKIARIKNADLIVLGRKRELEGSGLLSSHIVRKSPASVLLVTENPPPKWENILVPIDFSRHSALTYYQAQNIKNTVGAQVHLFHVYDFPTGIYRSGKTHQEISEILKSYAKNEFRRFCEDNEFPDPDECKHVEEEGAVPDHIFEQAEKTNADLIMIGSRGRTPSAALLVGSVVEKLVKKDSDIPMLIVKKKGENMTFLEALMKV